MRFGGDQPYEPEPGQPEVGRCEPGDTAPFVGPRVPPWVTDTTKWLTLSRTERRKLERHHKRVSGE